MSKLNFVIDAIPRTGSTSLARMLACHKNITCLIEPFHPARYMGRFHNSAIDRQSLLKILDGIWLRWAGIKHVWEPPSNWPFMALPSLNDDLVMYAPAVISLQRENLLQRLVSQIISRELMYWIGPRAEYLRRVDKIDLPELNCGRMLETIKRDKVILATRQKLLVTSHPKVKFVSYESIFGTNVNIRLKISRINEILHFLGEHPLEESEANTSDWVDAADPAIAKWNTAEIYERIPGIWKIENKVGSDETGWLFR